MDQAQRLREIMSSSMQQHNAVSRVISVTSGKGGVGKTSLTVNLAIALANQGKRVVIFDADFGFANIDVLLGAKSKFDVSHVLRGEKSISDIMALGHGGIRFISGGAGLAELINLDNARLEQLLSELLELDVSADYIIFDTGAGVNDKILSVISASEEVILVCTPEPTSIMDAFVMAKTILMRNRNPLIKLVVNRADSYSEAISTRDNFCKVVQKHLGVEVISLGYIMQDINVVNAVKQQIPLLLGFPETIASKNIVQIAKKYSSTDTKTAPQEQRGIIKFIEKLK